MRQIELQDLIQALNLEFRDTREPEGLIAETPSPKQFRIMLCARMLHKHLY